MTPERKVYGDASGVWACYAATGGTCYAPPGALCPCDGWPTFLTSWGSLADALEEDEGLLLWPGRNVGMPADEYGRLPRDCK